MRGDILNKIQIGILEYDGEFRCIYANTYIKNILSIELQADLNIIVYQKHIHPDDIKTNQEMENAFMTTRCNSDNICRILVKGETYKWFKIKRTFEETYIYTFEDINETKELEIELRLEKVRAEKAYNHKTLFLANMSHEIRTPLNGIIGMLTLLEDTILNNDQKNYIEMLRECSINLMTIINDILDYSKLEAGKIKLENKCIDIRNCIDSTNDIIMSKIYEKHLEYKFNISPNMPLFITGDVNRIKQVLLNLLTNSTKFTEKGQIELNISAQNKGDDLYIKFSISDTGCGVEKSERDKLFKSFSQVESQLLNKINQGTGLGLAIAKELVTLMGGEIWVDWSEVGKGSRFCFTIKATKCDDIVSGNEYDNNILKNKKVFILDDKVENRMGLASIVQRWGMKVTSFNSGLEALYLLRSSDYDLGLVDICMPDMNGVDFSNRLHQQLIGQGKPPIPLIALTSLGDTIDQNNERFRSHLIKPVKETKLKKDCIQIITLSKYKFKKEEESSPLELNTYLKSNNLDTHSFKENVRILLVEDVLINQKVVISFLNKMGYAKIDVCDNGKQCLEMLVKNKYDIILLDIRMPIMNGEIVINYINSFYSDKIPKPVKYNLANPRKPYIIAVTAYCLKEDREKYISMGFDNYVPKPININELHTVMNLCIENLLLS
jgi:signal transduction histidine kinase/DNA-binding response OmpR family regulator